MKTFAIATLGCKVNTYESESYVVGMKALGYTEVDFQLLADIYIINTCAVTNTASAKSRQKINHAKRLNPNAFICVVGCYAQMNPAYISDTMGVDLLLGSTNKKELPNLIDKCIKEKCKANMVTDINHHLDFEEISVANFHHLTRAFLKIQDGCNQFCSYCIIPYVRGEERSLAPDKVIATAQELVNNHHLEIVLAGIHTGRYGHEHGHTLTKLLKRMLSEVQGIKRIRISSIEISEISDELISLIKEDDRIAKHLHIPLQSGSDNTLKAMNRPYNLQQFKTAVNKIRTEIPNINISSDVIVGFPNESNDDFKDTCNTCKDVGFSFMHVFPYSKRDGTQAASLPNQLDNNIKKERGKLLGNLSLKLYNDYKASFIGKHVSVLVETASNNQSIGHSSEYLRVIINTELNKGELYDVLVTDLINQDLIAVMEE
ncbi:MAG: tRNA (N(6)-L-threonylcarbamoyladenosine(37)-C(2))-methylthiotransferase MtaB [Erysipelotrichaceae bacterium]